MTRIAVALLAILLAAPAVAQSKEDQRAQIKMQQDGIKASRRLAELQFAKENCSMTLDQAAIDDLVATAMMGGQLNNVDFVMMTLRERSQAYGQESVCKALRKMYGQP